MNDPEKAPHRPVPPDRRGMEVDRDLWRHCIESCPLVSVAVLLAAWILPRSVPLDTVAGGLALLTAVTWFVSLKVTGSAALSSWLLAWGAVLTAWYIFARVAGPWTARVLTALVFAVVILTPLGPPAIASYRARGNRDAAAEDRARQRAELAKWETMFARLGVRGIKVVDVISHQNGIQVHGYLGKATDEHGVVTFDRLKAFGPEVATDRRLARDAASFEQPDPDNSAAFILHLRTRKGRRATIYLPENETWTTVNEPLELGQHDNGRPFRLLLREIAVMIVGVIGAGKSNLLNVFIAKLAWCGDALIFVIDLKGGRMARPWIMPWAEDPGGVRRPVIDWLATTRQEADLMLDTLLAAGDERALAGAGGEKITPRRDRPAVLLLVDETAVATGHDRRDEDVSSRKLAVKLARLTETYRSEAISPVVAAVRGDVETMGLSAVKAMALARIGLRVSQSDDGRSVFPDDPAAAKALAQITDDGAGLVLLKGRISAPVHFYRMTPRLAYRIAQRTGPRRPGPDPHLEAALGEAYATRWERMAGLLETWRATADQWREDAGIHEGPRPAPARPGPRPADGADADADRDEHAPRSPVAVDDSEGYIDSVLHEVIASVEDPEGKTHPARHRMRELLFQAGARGYTVGALHKELAAEAASLGNPELAVHRGTLHDWLRKDEELGRVRRKGRAPGDPYARWIWIREPGDDSTLDGHAEADTDDPEDWDA